MSGRGGDPRSATLELLDTLIGFDTVSDKTNLPLVERVETYLRAEGIEFTRVPNGEGDRAAIFATVGPRTDGGIVLSGHTDVVPVKGQRWSSDPFTMRAEGGKVFGRGSCDMKAFGAICLAMLPVFRDAGLTKPIHLLLSYDEEVGCLGSLDTIARFGADLPRPALCIVGEPTEMKVVNAHKSIASYVTTVHGKEAHSSNPALGANAIESACAMVTELYRLQARLEAEGDPSGLFDPGFSTLHVGTIEGGHARNILARECRFGWEFRGLPGVDPQRAIDYIEAYATATVLPRLTRHAPEASIETRRSVEVPGLAADEGSEAEVLVKRLARTNAVGTASFATEAGQFQRNGIATIVCGPGSIHQAHQPDEFITLEQIDAGLAFMHRLAAELA